MLKVAIKRLEDKQVLIKVIENNDAEFDMWELSGFVVKQGYNGTTMAHYEDDNELVLGDENTYEIIDFYSDEIREQFISELSKKIKDINKKSSTSTINGIKFDKILE